MAITFNPLFDYGEIAKQGLRKLGLKEQLPELPEGFSFSEDVKQEDALELPEGFSFAETDYKVPPEATAIPNYVNNLAESFAQRKKELNKIVSDYDTGKINILEANVQTFGKPIAGGTLDILGETAMLGLEGVSWIVPDSIEQPVIDTMKKSWDFLTKTEAGKYAGEQLRQGASSWNKYKKENPENARTVEALVNTAVLFAPLKKKASLKPENTHLGTIGISALEEAAEKQSSKKSLEAVENWLRPERKPENVKDINDTGSVFALQKVGLSDFEKDRARLISNIDGVSPLKNLVKNANIIRKHNQKKADKLLFDLENSSVTWNFPQATESTIRQRVNDLLKNNTYLQSDTTILRQVELNIDKAMEIVNKFNTPSGTPAGLLKARREFDKEIKKQTKGKAFDPKNVNASTESTNAIRTVINELIDERVDDVNVKKSLKEQSSLWQAQEIIDAKAAKIGSSAVSRQYDRIKNLVGIQLTANRLIAVGGGMSAFHFAQTAALPIAGSVILAGFGYGAVRGVQSVATKKALAQLLKLSDRAINVSKNKEMIKQLRMDKAIIQDLFEIPLEKEESQK